MEILGLFNYWAFAVLLMVGLYALISKQNLVKKIMGLTIFQSAVFLFFITTSKLEGGTAPILQAGKDWTTFSNPLPQVLILTAIVVGISVTALALAVVVRIHEEYGTIEDDEILAKDREA
jgi:multicomponent Na+:H+ antiporter subunit C